MTSEQYEKIGQLYHAALERAPTERAAFLAEACGADKVLHNEVVSLLAAHAQASTFIERLPDDLAAGWQAAAIALPKQSFSHYRMLSPLGQGGMGEVWLAEDTQLGRKVAVKLLPTEFTHEAERVRRFAQEARAASALNHPNIITIHEIGQTEDTHYIVTEYVEGETLRQRMTQQQLQPITALELATQIATALTAAHEAGIIHRDIKPENVMVRRDGIVKVLDFGLAKLTETAPHGTDSQASTLVKNSTASGMVMGTPRYMSPEQARGEKVDERTDIFSLGVMLYEMLAGRAPFAGATTSEVIAAILRDSPPPLAETAPATPPVLERIICQALCKDRVERHQTAKDLLADLQQLKKRLEFDVEMKQELEPSRSAELLRLPAETEPKVFKTKTRISIAVLVVLLIGAIGLGAYFLSAGKKSLSAVGKKSLAVLPFVNASQDPNAEYLSDGITESVINNLSQLAGLKVMSRNSAFRFKNHQTDPRNIAAQLGVEALITGDIKQLGDKFIINVRLIDASDDSQIWGQQYVKTSGDVIAAQNEIAQAVANNLRLKLTASEQKRLAKNYTENAEAYQLYLRGRFHVFKLTPPEVSQGIAYFQQAIALDQNYALAYAGLAEAYRSLALGAEMLPAEFLPKSRAAANKAIEIDEAFSEGHGALGASLFWEWQWVEAENQLKRAIELSPRDTNAHIFYAHLLSNTGRHTEALAEAKRARELDPLFPFVNALEGQFLLHAGRTDEALTRLQKTFDLAPNFWMPHLFASSVYIEKGLYAEAVMEAHKARELSPAQTFSMSCESYALAKSGKPAEAHAVLHDLTKLSNERWVPPYNFALILNGLGEKDEAFVWLERAFQQHDPKMTFLKVEPKWNNLHGDPRFQSLLRRVGFIA